MTVVVGAMGVGARGAVLSRSAMPACARRPRIADWKSYRVPLVRLPVWSRTYKGGGGGAGDSVGGPL